MMDMKKLEQFKNYLSDNTKPLEYDDFSKVIINEYYEEQVLKSHWKSILANNVSSDFEELSVKLESIENQPSKTLTRKFIIPLSLVALLIMICLVIQFNRPVQKNKLDILLAEHYSDVVTRDIVKGPVNVESLRSQAFEAYQNKEYPIAIDLFQQLVVGNRLIEDSFFLGLSHLYIGQSEKAIKQLLWILDQKNSQRSDSVIWYLGLAYADSGNYREARYYLNQVAQWGGNKGKTALAKDAQEILDLLD